MCTLLHGSGQHVVRVVTDSETLSGTEAMNVESHLNQALKDMASYSEATHKLSWFSSNSHQNQQHEPKTHPDMNKNPGKF